MARSLTVDWSEEQRGCVQVGAVVSKMGFSLAVLHPSFGIALMRRGGQQPDRCGGRGGVGRQQQPGFSPGRDVVDERKSSADKQNFVMGP